MESRDEKSGRDKISNDDPQDSKDSTEVQCPDRELGLTSRGKGEAGEKKADPEESSMTEEDINRRAPPFALWSDSTGNSKPATMEKSPTEGTLGVATPPEESPPDREICSKETRYGSPEGATPISSGKVATVSTARPDQDNERRSRVPPAAAPAKPPEPTSLEVAMVRPGRIQRETGCST